MVVTSALQMVLVPNARNARQVFTYLKESTANNVPTMAVFNAKIRMYLSALNNVHSVIQTTS